MIGGLGGMEIVVILLAILLFFGAKRIPELARGVGQGINEFRKASDEIKKELDQGKKEDFSARNSRDTQTSEK